ncbi:MAG: hypothetical protein KDE52_03460, partial [Calditrichaeota bacterium]|nr:hypothetical protein [Calditrichota bacterium]
MRKITAKKKPPASKETGGWIAVAKRRKLLIFFATETQRARSIFLISECSVPLWQLFLSFQQHHFADFADFVIRFQAVKI